MTLSVSNKGNRFVISEDALINFSMIAFMCSPLVKLVFRRIFLTIGLAPVGSVVSYIVIYTSVFLLVFLRSERTTKAVLEFLFLHFTLIVLLSLSLLIHPEYEYWFTRETYGVLPYVFRPDNGLYIYLFIRMVNDPDTLLKNLRVSSWLMYVYYFRQLLKSLSVGYWEIEGNGGEIMHLSYSLDFGYNVLLFVLVFMVLSFRYKRVSDIIGAFAGFIMIILAGSRGPILCIGVFIILYFICFLGEHKHKYSIVFLLFSFLLLVYFCYEPILIFVSRFLISHGLSSRFIDKILSGTIADGAGRETIWKAAIGMISERPLMGYGAMGARHVLSKIHIVGYPHQLFLELLIEYGVLFGGFFSIILIVISYKILSMKGFDTWKCVFIVFISNAIELMLSYTYWHKLALWAVIAVAMCIREYVFSSDHRAANL